MGTERTEELNRLKEIRKNAGLTQAELADMIGRPQSYIAKLENGTYSLSEISLKNACKIAQVLCCSAEDLAQESQKKVQ